MKYIDVVVDTKSDSVDNFFTYKTENDEIRAGACVRIPFGQGKGGGSQKKGYVFAVSDHLSESLQGRVIRSAREEEPIFSLTENDIRVCRWMRRRYFCRYYDAVACFLPAGRPPRRPLRRRIVWEADEAQRLPPPLTGQQQTALEAILPVIEKKRYKTFLLQGVTGSGKTELYMRTAAAALNAGRQAVILVPEISLTPQTIGRFVGRFGAAQVAVLHSRMSQGQRYEEWMRIRNGEAGIIVGARSAVFAPVRNPGVFIIDEEHETSYKSDQSPKYDAIEVAIRRAVRAGAAVLLGSATPSVVSRHRGDTGLYKKLALTERYNKNPLPRVEIADMRAELAHGNKSIFSAALFAQAEECLRRGRQIILFLNRRGYSPFISCLRCGYVMRCEDCGVSMTYHKKAGQAVCHFCGAAGPVPDTCPDCEAGYVRLFGAGTERVEELTREAFPDATVARLDLDTGTKNGGMTTILKDFEKGKTQILIGTQMVAKGLDFANVELVGVVAADTSLNIPDFRSAERTFQLITQVAGRAGRGERQGCVVIQTWMPDHFSIRAAARHDYEAFYREELKVRQALSYPPFGDLLRVVVLSSDEKKAEAGAGEMLTFLARNLEPSEMSHILGPAKAQIFKIGEDYRYHLHIKVPGDRRTHYERILSACKKKINSDKSPGWRIIIDVNPFSLL